MEKNDIFARNSGGELVIRTVNTTGDTSTNKNDVLKATVADDGTITTQWVAEA